MSRPHDHPEECPPETCPIDLGRYQNRLGLRNKLGRALWGVARALLFRTSPGVCHGWRRWLLRRFGAKVGARVRVSPTCRVWAPWNLEVGTNCWLGDEVECYNVDRVRIGDNAIVSQFAFLCSAGHDITDPLLPLVTAPVVVGEGAWVCAAAFVGMGVTVGPGAVVAARAVAVKDVEPWTVVGGNPARFLKKRVLKFSPSEKQNSQHLECPVHER